MKTSIVPAQVTSIEDTIAANLSLTQIILLIIPVFMAALIFAGLPPTMHVKVYKLIVIICCSLPLITLALKVRGQLVLKWIILLAGYRLRPRRYLFSAHSPCCCEKVKPEIQSSLPSATGVAKAVRLPILKPAEQIAVGEYLSNRQIAFYADDMGQLNVVMESK
ncbi:PrgI family protein [Patescibacteria group bacterium]|jgi:hypothetical protein|nr:PrgI family protein [Patescibacteria group bacterium]